MSQKEHAHTIDFRKDIDGLRGVAVLAVIFYHLNSTYFKTGYLGVDVFFVISGFLITNIILTQLKSSTFSIKEFYFKRIKRIFPALSIMILMVLVIGFFILFPDELKSLGLHTLAGAGFISNLLLYKEVGYFDLAAELKPLLHLWSLGIEEQFYLIIPLLLSVIYKFQKKIIPFLLIILMATSIYFFIDWNNDKALSLAFYSPISRFWEILIGSCVAYFYSSLKAFFKSYPFRLNFIKELLFLVLLLGLFFALTNFTNELKDELLVLNFVAVISTALIISLGETTFFSKFFLQNKLINFVGKISFPLYLFHWPAIVFAQFLFQKKLTIEQSVLLMAVITVLATLTYFFVEKPIRFKKNLSTRKTVSVLAISLFILGAFGFVTYKIDGVFTEKDKIFFRTFTTLELTNIDQCRSQYNIGKDFYCGLSNLDKPPTVLLIGDSHARHYFDALTKYYNKQGKTILALGRGGCPPFWGVDRIIQGEGLISCTSIYEKGLEILKTNSQFETVIIAAALNAYITNGLVFQGKVVETRDRIYQVYQYTFQKLIENFKTTNKKIIIAQQIPSLPFHPKNCFKRFLSDDVDYQKECAFSDVNLKQQYMVSNFVLDMINQKNKDISVFDPVSLFCKDGICRGKIGDKVLYSDENHINEFGSEILTKYLGETF